MSMTLQTPFWFRSRRGRALIIATFTGALLLAAIPAARAAQLVTLSGFWSAICLRADASSLVRCEGEKVTLTHSLQGGFACATNGPEGGVMAFRAECAIFLNATAQESVLQRLPWEVRRCLRLGDGRYLLLVGGHWRGGLLWGTQAVIWKAETGVIEPAEFVRPEWNSFEITSAPARAGSSQQVMVSVRKQAPFDPIWRVRPFLFQYGLRDRRFLPLWKGTSFSRPHSAVGFADWEPALEGIETVALEDLGNGERALSAYRFDGGMAMTRTSAAMKLGSHLDAVLAHGKRLPVAFAREDGGGRLVAFGEGNKMMLPGVCEIAPRLQTEALTTVPLAWTTLSAGGQPSALVLTPQGQLRLLPFKPSF
ncbi:MAG: hypothetical protein ACYC63_19920 [Armatimonadota bacterium]